MYLRIAMKIFLASIRDDEKERNEGKKNTQHTLN